MRLLRLHRALAGIALLDLDRDTTRIWRWSETRARSPAPGNHSL